jgi:hypothetical protein
MNSLSVSTSVYFYIVVAFTNTQGVQGLFLAKSGLQKIVRLNAVVSSVVDNLQVSLVSDRLLDDLVNIHMNKLDILYIFLNIFYFSFTLFRNHTRKSDKYSLREYVS